MSALASCGRTVPRSYVREVPSIADIRALSPLSSTDVAYPLSCPVGRAEVPIFSGSASAVGGLRRARDNQSTPNAHVGRDNGGRRCYRRRAPESRGRNAARCA